ncbi:MAG: DNA phosphorothioation-associated putative methyltransferase [Leptospira sp.]|nr:DNA phosphorothioation-associated putative methyltransferase [Leptospira sp.]
MSTDSPKIHRHRTAIRRKDFSQSFKALERHGFLDGNHSVFDYGCGLGDDIKALEELGITALGWDPVFRKETEFIKTDIVNLGFVLNVIEDPEERVSTLQNAFSLSSYLLVVSVMLGSESITEKFTPFRDGVLTSRNTFQKYFSQSEFREYLQKYTGQTPVAVGPGVFFLFTNVRDREVFLMQRQMERIPDLRQENIEFPRGKIEKNKEFLLQKKNDLLVYLSLASFQGIKHQSMPEQILQEIRGLFPSLTEAKKESTAILYSIADTNLIEKYSLEFYNQYNSGYLEEGHSFQFHSDYLDKMHPVLRVYVGIALYLYGDRELIDLIKIHFTSGKVTFLHYNNFRENDEPLLILRVKVNLRSQKIDFFEYGEEFSPQPLLDKERFIRSL